jgi:uncharacterized phiE125 gp8 family phage protein
MSFYNYLIDFTLTNVGTPTEPVTLAEAKNYCRVTTSADDALITDLITEAREAVEKATGTCLVQKTVKVWFNNPATNYNLPYGPMDQATFKLYDNVNSTEVLPANYRLVGGQYPSLNFPNWNQLRAEYTSGFASIPKELKIAIMDQINFDYENRGADIEHYDSYAVCEKTWRACQRYTRTSPIL